MKKIIFSIIISFLFITNIYADDINSFSCEYIIKNKDVNFKLIMDVTNYNKSDSSCDVKLQYENRNGEMVTLNGYDTTYNVKGSTSTNEDLYRFFALDKKFYNYLENFDNECQPLYLVNYKNSPTTFDIENNSIDGSLGKTTLIEVKNSTINANNVKQDEETTDIVKQEENKTDNKKQEEDKTTKEEVKEETKQKDSTNEESNGEFKPVELKIDDSKKTCKDILGPVLTQVIKGGIVIVQIVCAIIAILNGMLILVPAVVTKDADSLKKSSKKLAMLGIILMLVIIFKPLVRIIATLLEYDITCIL